MLMFIKGKIKYKFRRYFFMSVHSTEISQNVTVSVADPSAIGLFGLAMVTLVASSQKLGITSDLSYVLPVAIFLGGLAQIYASINDAKLNNTFGSTAFGAYGFFWLVVASCWLINYGVFGVTLQQAVDVNQLGFIYFGYLIFTLFMTYGAAGTHKVLFSIFVLIDFLFLGLSMSTFGVAPELGHSLAAYSELLIALLSFYGSGASVLNTHYKRVVLPVGKALIK
jgi:succinate-acetate transporter protein